MAWAKSSRVLYSKWKKGSDKCPDSIYLILENSLLYNWGKHILLKSVNVVARLVFSKSQKDGKEKAFKRSAHLSIDSSYQVFQLWEAGSRSVPKDRGQIHKNTAIEKRKSKLQAVRGFKGLAMSTPEKFIGWTLGISTDHPKHNELNFPNNEGVYSRVSLQQSPPGSHPVASKEFPMYKALYGGSKVYRLA